MADEYLIGEYTRLSVVVTNTAGTAADPGSLTLRLRQPDGTALAYDYGTDAEVIKDSTGHYHADIALDQAGVWLWRWQSDPPNAGADEGELHVQASKL